MAGWADPDAVVVGAGPNGLSAALTLAREGFKVTVLEAADEPGGGTRTYEDPRVVGLLHDHCSAVHPMGVASPFFRSLDLERFGLSWKFSDIDLAHPLDDGTAAVLHHEIALTVAGLGVDGPLWDRLFGSASRRFDFLAQDLLRPAPRIPRHPLVTAKTGAVGLLPATAIAGQFETTAAASLFAGLAAHSFARLDQPLTSAIALMLGGAGQSRGWPVAQGGSQSIWKALAANLAELGAEVVTGTRIRDFSELPKARVALFDTSPTQLSHILGDRLPRRARRRAEHWRYGPAAYKVDFAVDGFVPWTAEAALRAVTLHLGGTFEEIADAESEVAAGSSPSCPFTLVAQPHVADPSRMVDGVTPLWAYAHVPHGSTEDASSAIQAQIERFAPGFGARVIATNITTPADFEDANPNLHGGDISGGANTVGQLINRPRLAADPYATAINGVFLCSASTPPGGGVHGMCGHNAARSALRVLTA